MRIAVILLMAITTFAAPAVAIETEDSKGGQRVGTPYQKQNALFDFYFRIEIYVPKAKREFGYYVLPILHGDRLIGRIDPKMDRKTDTLHVNRVYAETDAPDGADVVTAVDDAVRRLAQFLGAKRIHWGEVPAQWAGLGS